ncbi:MAG TPA: acyl-CoA desaturase [Kofleriaceae bacterium]|nr:acyl-CoA desaturase [Kofleriaceae bacterium]
MTGPRQSLRATYFNLHNLPFWGVHVAAIVGVVALGFSWTGIILALGLYFGRMFFVTAGYHRYFAHRAFKTSRWFQLVLAVGAQTSAQRGVLWWAANHRDHHRDSDTERDLHAPRHGGFWWSHLGWMLCTRYQETRNENVRDLARFPELVWLNRFNMLPPVVLAVALFFIGGAHALVWGFFVSTVLLWHGTFTINSLSHLIGRRRYATGDDSRNNWVLAIVTMGEGWHNNHHHYMGSVAQGFFWWEIDLSAYVLKALAALGFVWDVRRPPPHIVEGRCREGLPITELFQPAATLARATPAAACQTEPR